MSNAHGQHWHVSAAPWQVRGDGERPPRRGKISFWSSLLGSLSLSYRRGSISRNLKNSKERGRGATFFIPPLRGYFLPHTRPCNYRNSRQSNFHEPPIERHCIGHRHRRGSTQATPFRPLEVCGRFLHFKYFFMRPPGGTCC